MLVCARKDSPYTRYRTQDGNRKEKLKTFNTFNDLSLPKPFYGALKQMGFLTPTPVQAASLPPALAGQDILGTAQTGTGKTGAFGIPLLAKLYSNPGSRALILAPTRELAAQIHKVLAQMSAGTKLKGALLVGGESFFRQKTEVKEGADYYVCTPGRLIDHLDAGCILDHRDVGRVPYSGGLHGRTLHEQKQKKIADLERAYIGVVEILSESLDASERYTKGHWCGSPITLLISPAP